MPAIWPACAESGRKLPIKRLINQRDGLRHAVKRDEAAKAGTLGRSEQHLVDRAEPVAEVLETMLPAGRIDDRLQLLRIGPAFPGSKPVTKIRQRFPLGLGGCTEAFGRLHVILKIAHRMAA